MSRVEELRTELNEAIQLEADAKQAERDTVKAVWKFTIGPADSWATKDVYDDTCRVYKLDGEVVNKAEVEAVGRTVFSGGMNYVFNTLSGKLVMGVDGGQVYISHGWRSHEDDFSDVIAMTEISAFLVVNPKGGDITEIITRHQTRRGGWM